jgi:Fur family ferric uptake transcriptional regulator
MLQKNYTYCHMEDKKAILADILKRNGFSLTRPRILVFDVLNNSEPQSMHDIYEKLKNQIDRASLYRVIKVYEKVGIVQRVNIGWKYKLELSDIFIHHHHHISCLSCHKLIAIKEDQEIEKLIQEIAQKHRLKATSHQLEVQGYCSDCQE